MTSKYERTVIRDVEVFHTFRGNNEEVEVYTYQDGNITYSLYKNREESRWACDWTSSYNRQVIKLDADPSNEREMLEAFAALLKSKQAQRESH